MADIRIKDLTTTASSSASDDFIAVDGTTNGTRKLNAYSPSFGGNATVGGALTATNGITVGEDAQITNSSTVASGTRLTLNTKAQQGIDIYRSDANANYSGIRFRNSANSATNAEIGWSGTTLRMDAATVELPATTASTSISTGALVVSGGVGVAGAINVGGKVQFPSDTTSTRAVAFGSDINFFRRGDNTFGFTGSAGSGIQLACGTDPYFQGIAGSGYIRFFDAGSTVIASSGTAALTLTSAQKAEFAATIKTAAPAGGTAAEWKLGTVASVSPTSPNRTIEVDIGGTIYYIHAKTTNN